MSQSPRVIKLGGSLLAWPDLAAGFHRWLAGQPPAANIVVVGGGPVVEALRQLDRALDLPAATCHWLAVRAMGLTAALAAEVLYDAVLVTSMEQWRLSQTSGVQIFDVERFLREDAATDDALPAGWDVTSDSIAARVAVRIEAAELVLLKSALPAGAVDRESLARGRYVDAYFPRAAQSLGVRCVNLRDDAFSQIAL